MDLDFSYYFKVLSGSKLDVIGSVSGESCKLELEIYLYNRLYLFGGKGLR